MKEEELKLTFDQWLQEILKVHGNDLTIIMHLQGAKLVSYSVGSSQEEALLLFDRLPKPEYIS